MARFPKFFYSDSKSAGSVGAVIFHMNFPRAVFAEKMGCLVILHWIDMPTTEEKQKVIDELKEWHANFVK